MRSSASQPSLYGWPGSATQNLRSEIMVAQADRTEAGIALTEYKTLILAGCSSAARSAGASLVTRGMPADACAATAEQNAISQSARTRSNANKMSCGERGRASQQDEETNS